MKKIILVSLCLFGNFAMAFGSDFSGSWVGMCILNGKNVPTGIVIKNDLNSISYDGDLYSLNQPTVVKSSGNSEGQPFQQIYVNDWKWNQDKTMIKINERMLGWYSKISGTWSGNGTASIRIDNGKLLTNREFLIEVEGVIVRQDSEQCTFNLKNK